MTDQEIDWEAYAKHVETALQRAQTRARTLGDECKEKFTRGRNAHDLVEAEVAYWLVDMIDDLRRDMQVGTGYDKGVRQGATYWRAHAYLSWARNDNMAVEVRQLKEQIRKLKDDLDVAQHK